MISLDKWQWGKKPAKLYFSHLLKICQILTFSLALLGVQISFLLSIFGLNF